MIRHLFPFDMVEKGSKIVIYGAGLVGQDYVRQLKSMPYAEILCVIDRNREIRQLLDIPVISPDCISTVTDYNYIVIAVTKYAAEIYNYLIKAGIENTKIVNCSSSHNLTSHNLTSHNLISSFSSHKQDVIIKTIFDSLEIEKPSYMDLGAMHPTVDSNTALFYQYGCRGINVDASPDSIEVFKLIRPDDINVNAGIGKTAGTLPFYVFDGIHGCNTFHTQHIPEVRARYNLKNPTTFDIPVVTLSDIVNKYCNGVYPDYIDCDLEGLDYEVLESADFSAGRPFVINVECGKDNGRMSKMMQSKGFQPVIRFTHDIIFVRKEFIPVVVGIV